MVCLATKAQDSAAASAMAAAAEKHVETVAAETAETENNETPKYWKVGGNVGLNFSQAAFKNWAAGGENTMALNAYLNLSADYKKDKVAWDNDLSLEYGMIYQANAEDYKFKKNVDKIDFSSKFGYQASKHLYYTVLADFKSQFANGYDYSESPRKFTSQFAAPAYVLISAGLDYKPVDCFSLYFSPATGKFTIVNRDTYEQDTLGNFISGNYQDKMLKELYGVEYNKKAKAEFGAYLKLKFTKDLCKNVNLSTKADFFTAYNESFGNIDVDWETIITMKINEFLSANLSVDVKYDDDVKTIDAEGNKHGAKIQVKELLGVGLVYKF